MQNCVECCLFPTLAAAAAAGVAYICALFRHESGEPMNSVTRVNHCCRWFCVTSLLGAVCSAVNGLAVEPHGGMMRYPDVSRTQIAFVYADDLWVAPRTGGQATPLASPRGGEAFPRFSADGQRIAFVGNYDGNVDIYVMPVSGGIPHRVTYHGSRERLCDWTFDNRLLIAMSGLGGLSRQAQLFTVSGEGGMLHRLPTPYGGYGVVSGDGQWLAYTPRNRDFRTWKRYRGGMASDIWLFHLTNHTSQQITDWEGTDTIPMWHGEQVYYLSDAGPHHRLNVWSYDIQSQQRKQVTHFKDFDVKWPSNGPGAGGEGEIVFEYNGQLYLLDLQRNAAAPVHITVPGARPRLRPVRKDVSTRLSNWFISPQAKRVLVESRGDIWSLPASKGTPRNLTRSSGVAEREPTWSPDGKWISYFSDGSDEYELVLRSTQEGQGERTATKLGPGFRYQPAWSPDSQWLVFSDHEDRFYILDVDAKAIHNFDRINSSSWRWGVPLRFRWSPDSQWLTYTKPDRNNINVVMLYNVCTREAHQVTGGMFVDSLPTFDRRGDYLYFFSQREISNPDYADTYLTFVYRDTAILHAVPLRRDVENPFRAESDEESDGQGVKQPEKAQPEKAEPDDQAKDADRGTADGKQKPVKRVEIELEGFEARAFRIPVKRGRFSYLAVNDKHQLVYLRRGDEPTLQLFDPHAEEPQEKTVLKDVRSAQLTPDGAKLLVRSGGRTGVIAARPGQQLKKTVVTQPMSVVIQPREEWQQLFSDAWRFMRDFFYDPNMHQVDWPAIRKQYGSLLDDCVSRRDVGFVISEMISEVNAGHTYYREGDVDSGPRASIGYLGVDFELADGYYRIRQTYAGGSWDTDARSIVHQLSAEQREQCKFVFAVNGLPIDTSKAPWAAFEGLAGQTVVLSVGAEPNPVQAIKVTVKLLASENALRYRHWVEKNRQYVDKQSDGQVGYIYVPDTGERGQRELFRQFYGQMNRSALIIDERWNGGGNIADRFVELLNRPIYLHLFERYENDWRVPTLSHQGPKCMLINGRSGSGGDIFPYLFRKAGLGKLIGLRTWGGVIGIARNPSLIDGGSITVPFITFYETDGTLTMEGHGVDPDLVVVDDPALMVDGGDPQLDAAIEHMLDELKRNPYRPARRPPYPNRRGMGIREENK